MVDIIIPFFNKSELTIQCLQSIMQACLIRCRVVLVDDGSDIGESKKVWNYISQTGWPHLFCRKEINKGYKEAIQTGIQKCDKPYVMLLNNDTLLTPGFDKKLLQALDGDHSVVASAPVSNHPTDLFQFRDYLYSIWFEDFSTPAEVNEAFERHAPAARHEFTIAPYLTGMCLLFDREKVLKLGMFGEHYQNGYFEDLDLCCRIREAGFRLAIAEDCFVFHYGHSTYRQKPQEEKYNIIFHNFKVFKEKWGHIPEHNDLLLKMEFAGKEDPI